MRQTIKSLAAEIRQRWPSLYVEVDQGYCNTDRQMGRLRHAGKGRLGSHIRVWESEEARNRGGYLVEDLKGQERPRPLLDHNNAETYRRTSDVRRWMEEYARMHPDSHPDSKPVFQRGRPAPPIHPEEEVIWFEDIDPEP